MGRFLVVGDIHGGLRALKEVLEKASVTTSDTLLFLGDYVDGWSESAQTIDFLIELAHKQQCIFLKGNHDEWCEGWLRVGDEDPTWIKHGGISTIKSYANHNAIQRQEHLQFFERLHLWWIDNKMRVFVHAGFKAELGPQYEEFPTSVYWDRSMWEAVVKLESKKAKSSRPLPKQLQRFSEVFIGHTPTIYYQSFLPMHCCNVWNLDTGAAFTGALTIMDADSKQFWQSTILQDLYPAEAGRNSH